MHLEGFTSNAGGLFDWLRARITTEELGVIAAADYGYKQDEHLAALEHIKASGVMPNVTSWTPVEVLELTRWAKPPKVNHLTRAFACAIVCRIGDPADDGIDSTGVILLESCIALGPEPCALVEGLFTWRAEEHDPPDPMAMLLLVLLRARENPLDPRVAWLVAQIESFPWEQQFESLRMRINGAVSVALWDSMIASILAPHRNQSAAIATLLARAEPES